MHSFSSHKRTGTPSTSFIRASKVEASVCARERTQLVACTHRFLKLAEELCRCAEFPPSRILPACERRNKQTNKQARRADNKKTKNQNRSSRGQPPNFYCTNHTITVDIYIYNIYTSPKKKCQNTAVLSIIYKYYASSRKQRPHTRE